MLDVRRVRTELDALKAGLARKGVAGDELDRLAELDRRRRELSEQRDDVRARVKALSREGGALRRAGEAERAEALMAESRDLGTCEKALSADADLVAGELRDLLLRIPNLPAAEAPDGDSEADNVVLRVEGFDPDAYGDHQRVPHWEVGAALGILDLGRGAKISGSMFPLYRG
ncbi:MAG: serine--tRNA ligase, partial [Actinomycetota bacterium]|nr:serine--tRNA ligase [Actinomycetota bacterium]